jgi:hypothetical protein
VPLSATLVLLLDGRRFSAGTFAVLVSVVLTVYAVDSYGYALNDLFEVRALRRRGDGLGTQRRERVLERARVRPPELVDVVVDHPVGAQLVDGEPRQLRHPVALRVIAPRLEQIA